MDEIIEDALNKNASDIHLDPFKEYSYLRYRIDGILYPANAGNSLVFENIISQIKVSARLPLDDRRLPKDGKFHWVSKDGFEVDIRVSIMPTSFGENAVLRLFCSNQGIPKLEDLGFDKEQIRRLDDSISNEGLIVIGGSTGSGKTTTLYSILSLLNNDSVSIVTVEDPVECRLRGARQIEVGGNTLLRFSTVLRSVLRQDPDIIMIGEIRDSETAEMAVHAALTGHLVLSTIHASSVRSIRERFIYLGVDENLLRSVLQLQVHQRLISHPDKGRKLFAEMI